MYYEVYIDVFFLENFMVDSLILVAVKKMQKLPGKFWRVFAGGMLGAVLTCLLLFWKVPVLIKYTAAHLVINILMLNMAMEIKNIFQMVRAIALFYMTAVMFGGIMHIFIAYLRYVSIFYGVAVLTYFLVLGFWKITEQIRNQQKDICEVTVFTKKGKFLLNTLVDTGNGLTDQLSGDPVCVTDSETAENLFGVRQQEWESKKMSFEVIEKEKIRFISYRTIAGESIMPIIRAEKMIVHFREEQEIIKPLIGICMEPVSERQLYQMILNPDILGGAKNVSKSGSTTAVQVENSP